MCSFLKNSFTKTNFFTKQIWLQFGIRLFCMMLCLSNDNKCNAMPHCHKITWLKPMKNIGAYKITRIMRKLCTYTRSAQLLKDLIFILLFYIFICTCIRHSSLYMHKPSSAILGLKSSLRR